MEALAKEEVEGGLDLLDAPRHGKPVGSLDAGGDGAGTRVARCRCGRSGRLGRPQRCPQSMRRMHASTSLLKAGADSRSPPFSNASQFSQPLSPRERVGRAATSADACTRVACVLCRLRAARIQRAPTSGPSPATPCRSSACTTPATRLHACAARFWPHPSAARRRAARHAAVLLDG